MSGGSFNYLCYKDTEDLFNRISDLEDMRESLIKYGYEDIAKDTQRLIEYIKSAKCTIGTLKDMLEPVFHAVEWYESADYSEKDYIETVDKFKAKWFKGDRTERLKGYIDKAIEDVREDLYNLLGE